MSATVFEEVQITVLEMTPDTLKCQIGPEFYDVDPSYCTMVCLGMASDWKFILDQIALSLADAGIDPLDLAAVKAHIEGKTWRR
jgi:hypothetical protein